MKIGVSIYNLLKFVAMWKELVIAIFLMLMLPMAQYQHLYLYLSENMNSPLNDGFRF